MPLMIGYGSPTQTYDFFAYNTGGKVWNGFAFVTKVDVDFITYRIAPTTQVGNRFTANAPNGTASYELRKRASSLALSRTVWEDRLDVVTPEPTPTPTVIGGALDAVFGPLANTLIGVFGGSATLTQYRKEYDKRTDQNVNKTSLTWPVKIYPPVAFTVRQWNGSPVEEGDLKTGISREALEQLNAPVPAIDMGLTINGKIYRIKSVLPVSSGNLIALYEMQVGR